MAAEYQRNGLWAALGSIDPNVMFGSSSDPGSYTNGLSGGTNSISQTGMVAALYGCKLWLEIARTTNSTSNVVVTLHNTTPGRGYKLWNKQQLVATQSWTLETNLTGASGQDWTATTVSMNGRSNLFFIATALGNFVTNKRPEVPLDKWELKIHGQVENPVTLNWEQFMALPQFDDVSDFHCVTTWSQFDMHFQGVAFFTIADLVKPKPDAAHVFFKSFDGYSTNNLLEVCMDDDVMIAHSWNGQPLTKEHGGPARVIIPKRYAWKGAKFVREISFLDHDIRGFWEIRGYSNTADPWKEDRFS